MGLGDDGAEWEYERVGTQKEKINIEKELHELHENLALVEQWKARRDEIDGELAEVWVAGGTSLGPSANAPKTPFEELRQ